MISSKYILGFVVVAFAAIVFFTLSSSNDNYVESIEIFRKQYEENLRVTDDSPFKEVAFEGLNFYAPNPDYRVDAKSVPLTDKEIISLSTSDGKKRNYVKTTLLIFELHNRVDTLTLLQNLDDPTDYFLPFIDETSGEATYGAGRYLPVEPSKGEKIELDFNRAFNPYCAYNEAYSCPMPPKENYINSSVEAGEKNYAQH